MFSKYVKELKKPNPRDKASMFVGKKDELDAFSGCVKELEMRQNATDKIVTPVERKHALNLVQSVKELKKMHDPKDETLMFGERNNKHLHKVERPQLSLKKVLSMKELKKMHNPKDETLMFGERNNKHLHKVERPQLSLKKVLSMKELKKMHNPKDETLDRKDDLNLVQSMKELKKMHNPKDETLTFVNQEEEDLDSILSEKEVMKMYDPKDKTLTFVDGQDDLDPVSSEDGCLTAKMSCGHAVTPQSLTGYCRNRLDEGDYIFKCPALVRGTKKCNKPWSYQEVRRLADLSPEEMQYFEKTIALLAAVAYCETQPCPQCNTNMERTDLSNLCVTCTICAADGAPCSVFCWQCQKPWKGESPRRYRCGNLGCVNKDLQLLKSCRTISLPEVRGATNCPSVRACPTCGLKVEHNQQYCKNINCPRCQVEFCFICLKLKRQCVQTSLPYEICASGVAPRQTSIPIWHKK